MWVPWKFKFGFLESHLLEAQKNPVEGQKKAIAFILKAQLQSWSNHSTMNCGRGEILWSSLQNWGNLWATTFATLKDLLLHRREIYYMLEPQSSQLNYTTPASLLAKSQSALALHLSTKSNSQSDNSNGLSIQVLMTCSSLQTTYGQLKWRTMCR